MVLSIKLTIDIPYNKESRQCFVQQSRTICCHTAWLDTGLWQLRLQSQTNHYVLMLFIQLTETPSMTSLFYWSLSDLHLAVQHGQ